MRSIFTLLRALLCCLVVACSAGRLAAQVSSFEYFFDADPGLGNGISVNSGFTAGQMVDFNMSIPLNGLQAGFHQCFFRAKSANGQWGLCQSRAVYVTSVATGNGDIVASEYFFDADPGVGHATSLAIASGSAINQNVVIPVTGLQPGFHQLYVRVKNTGGTWGYYQSRAVYISTVSNGNGDIAGAEYFFDTEPGVGHGTALSLAAGNPVQNVMIPVGSLAAGFHQLYVRIRNTSNSWSHYQTRSFVVASAANTANRKIAGAEYYVDTDPGVGRAMPVVINPPADNINQTFTLPVAGTITEGAHQLVIRVKNEQGLWSLFQTKDFIVKGKKPGSGYAVSFDGNDDYGTAAFAQDGAANTFTYEVWVNPGSSVIQMVSPANSGITGTSGQHYIIYPSSAGSSNNAGFGLSVGANGIQVFEHATNYLPALLSWNHPVNGWTHIAVVYDQKQPSLYVNGVLAATGLTSTRDSVFATTEKTVTIGGGTYGKYDGRIDELRIWNTALSANDIRSWMCKKLKPGHPQFSNLAGSFNFDEGSGPEAYDDYRSGKITFLNGPSFALSGAPLGDVSVNSYSGAAATASLSNPVRGDVFTATLNNGSADGIQLYCVTDTPNHKAGTTCLGGNNGYFGVFAVNDPNAGYQASYNYTGLPMAGFNESQLKIYTRTDNAATPWTNDTITVDTAANTAAITGNQRGEYIVSNAIVSPTIAITAAPATTVCPGMPVMFTTAILNGGDSPVYQWKKNGNPVTGATASAYTDSTLANGDLIACELVSNSACVSPASATSAAFTASVSNSLTASVSVAASPGSDVCAGTQVTFTATPVNGGAAPVYQWKINGIASGGNASTYTSNSFSNGDVVTCAMSTNAPCAGPAMVTGAAVTMNITPVVTPTITITSGSGAAICNGVPVTFMASVQNGGATPVYQWRKNNQNVGVNSNAYTDSALSNQDIITCQLSSNALCGNPVNVTSNGIAMLVNSSAAPAIAIINNTGNTICAGTVVTFNAAITNGGATPSYQWKKNGSNTGINSGSYKDSTLTTGDMISCELTSSSSCALPQNAVSNSIAMAVNPFVTPSVTIAASPSDTICAGTLVTFTSTAVNAGISPSYQWKKNGLNTGGNAAIYTDQGLLSNDVITCVVTSANVCAAQPAAISNTVTLNVRALPIVNAGADQTVLRGSSVTLTATGGGHYLWSNGDTSASTIVTPLTTTNYTVAATNAYGCSATDTMKVNVNFSSLSLSAGSINFGDVVSNTTSTATITITNNGTLTETISSALVGTPFSTTFTVQTITPNASVAIPVTFTPSALLLYQQTLVAHTSVGDFSVLLSGRGVNAVPSWNISPAIYAFGNVPVNDSLSHTFTIANTGNVPVNISSIISSNPVFTANAFSNSIPVGGQTTLAVKMKPLAIAAYPGQVTIAANGLTSLTLNVSGNGYVPGSLPVLQFVSASPYNANAGVDMNVAPPRAFTYRILYKNLGNIAPMAGYPKVGIDRNGDGDFMDTDEGRYSMSQVGNGHDWMNGEVFTYTQNLPAGSAYGYQFSANDSLGNTAVATNTVYVAGPLVTNQGLDLSIYANDITFSNNNPAVGQQFTVSAVVHNNSPYSASNVPVRFYKDSVFLAVATLPYIGPNTTATITHNFSFSPDGFYPIKVWIDSANTLAEANSLNNYAIRPVIVGNFSVPGTINIASAANTQSCPSPAVNISGTAVYSGLNLAGNPPVLGATVTVQIVNGPALTTNTVTGGNWSVYYSDFGCGQNLNYTVTVTDYTLANTTGTASFNAPCQSCGSGTGVEFPVNYAQGTPSGCLLENTPFSYAISYLNNCNHDTLRNDTTYVYADNVLKYTHTNARINPCITTAYNDAFNLAAGNHMLFYTNVHYDTAGRHEATYSTNVNIEPALADLSLGNFTQAGSTSFSVRDYNNVCVNAGVHKVLLYDSTAGNQQMLLDSFAVNSISGQSYQQWNYSNPALQTGYHYLRLVTDSYHTINERNELNNELNALLYVPFPELTVSNVVASTSNLAAGAQVNFLATIHNTGSSTGAFKVQFYAGGLPIGGRTSVSGLASGTTAIVLSNVFTMPAGNCPINVVAVADADHVIAELSENNNADSLNLGADIISGVTCSGAGSSCNPYVVAKSISNHFATTVSNTGIRDAGQMAVKFDLGGIMIGTDNLTGIAAQSSVVTGVDYTFNNAGNYVIHVFPDTANAICETSEANNAGAIYVNVVEGLPDLEILSQHISPSNLNPNPNQSITVVASVFNKGTQKSKPGVIRFLVDHVQLGADVPIDTLYPGRDTSVITTVTYSSPTVGPKIIEVIADATNTNTELRENNNAATRAIIVGGAPDFARSLHEAITFSKNGFRKGQNIDIRNYIRNYGGDSGSAWLKYYIVNDLGEKSLLDSVRFTLHSNDSAVIAKSWSVNMAGHGRVITEIAYSNPQEFNEFNNTDSVDFIAGPELNVTALNATSNAICEYSQLNIGYSIHKDAQTVALKWYRSGLYTGDSSASSYIKNNVALSDSGNYQLYVTDSFGTELSPMKHIIVDPVLIPTVSIAAKPGNVICKGNWVKFAATPVNGGPAPAYQWKKNGVNIGANKSIFIDTAVSNNDQIMCVMVSNETCTSTAPVSSSTIQMTVNGLSNNLASNNASQTNDNDSGMYFNYTDNNCQLIVTVSTDSLHDLGITTATTNIDAQFYGFVQRSVEITPTNNLPATVRLYFTQAEFNAYNTAVGTGHVKLPVNSSDPAVNNIVIYQYHGLPSAGTTGPGGRYDASNVSVIASASITKTWNAASGYWEISFPVNGFSGHFLKAQNIVPLTISIGDIAAANKGAINEVHWQTLNEINGDYFELERSADAKNFAKIARISMNGTPAAYIYMDNEALTGMNYYRLKMYERNGQFVMSKTVSASVMQGAFAMEVFPNPARTNIRVTLHDAVANGKIMLTDITGNTIRTMNATGNVLTLDLSELASGIYFVRYMDDLHNQTTRITKE